MSWLHSPTSKSPILLVCSFLHYDILRICLKNLVFAFFTVFHHLRWKKKDAMLVVICCFFHSNARLCLKKIVLVLFCSSCLCRPACLPACLCLKIKIVVPFCCCLLLACLWWKKKHPRPFLLLSLACLPVSTKKKSLPACAWKKNDRPFLLLSPACLPLFKKNTPRPFLC